MLSLGKHIQRLHLRQFKDIIRTQNVQIPRHRSRVAGNINHLCRPGPAQKLQHFWLATFAFIVCFALTVLFSLATKRIKTNEELKGLVYSLTPKLKDEKEAWYLKPAAVGVLLLIACVILNIIFW